MHDRHRPGPRAAGPAREDTRRWGSDPTEDRTVRGAGRGLSPEPSRHLAAGEGGHGDWTASAAGIGQRRGPAEPDRPFGADGVGGADPPVGPGTRPGSGARASRGRPGPWQAPRDDGRIHDEVCVRLARSGLDVADVSVDVRAGRATLAGIVADRPTKHAIESLVDDCRGVREVDNRIKVMRIDPPREAIGTPPAPRASVPQDSPTARDEARGRFSRPLPGGAGKSG